MLIEYIPYTLLLLVVISVLQIKGIKRSNRIYAIFLILALFSGLRFDVGHDYMEYYYAVLNPELHAGRFEFLFRQLCYWTKGMPWAFFMLTSIATYFLIFKAIKDSNVNIALPILAFICMPFFFLNFMCVVRFAFAVALIYYAYTKFQRDKKYLHFFIFIGIAINCHITALVAILLLIPFDKLNYKIHIIALISSFFIGQFVMQYMNALDFLSGIDLYYTRYLTNEGAEEGQKMLILYALFAALNAIALYKAYKQDIDNYQLLSLINVGFCLLFMFSYNVAFAGRISRYFLIFMLNVIPYYKIPLFNYKQTVRLLAVCLVILLYFELYIAQYSFYVTKSKSYMPYQTILLQ